MLVFALPALAEQKYYTWVDAQGNIHNSPVPSNSAASSSKPTSSTSTNTDEASTGLAKDSKSGFQTLNSEDFPSEEEFQKNLNDKPDGEKPFYTWIGPDGVIRNEVKPDVIVEFTATEMVYDAAFALPFRLPEYVTQGLCCESYAEHFNSSLNPKGSASFKVEKGSNAFKTQEGDVSAAYFSFTYPAAQETLTIKAFKIPKNSVFEIIALSSEYKPLYLASEINGSFVEETWKDIAYKQVMIEMSDPEIKHMVVFIKNDQGVAQSDYIMSIMRNTLKTQ
jgi:hypothetical protein